MILGALLLLAGLTISAVAIFYSVIGLAAIFAGATIPIYIMGGTLEIAKLIAAAWLKANWHRPMGFIKYYMSAAVLVLMLITSMGIFGFLSKAHLDQAVPTGDVQSQVALIDEKIKTQRDNIDASRKALAQMDAQVDARLSRSDDDRGAERAVQIRRAQARERTVLQNEIAKAQTEIAVLNEQKAPIASKLRAVEAEVGPIKYIATFIYGDDPDKNLLEKAVTWVIILIVIVFDPLAIAMLLAAQMTFQWHRKEKEEQALANPIAPAYEPDDGPLTDEQLNEIQSAVAEPVQPQEPKSIFEQHPYLNNGFSHFENLKPIVAESKVEETSKLNFSAEVEFVPAEVAEEPTTTAAEVDDADLKKKNQYMIKESGQQIVKNK
jgi:hypothetical protein